MTSLKEQFFIGTRTQTMEEIMISLKKQFFKGVKHIYWKNSGGCLFFCYAFKRFFEQNGGDLSTFKIVQYHIDWVEMQDNLKWIPNTIPKAMQHFMWMYEGKQYDGYGENDSYMAKYRSVLEIPLEQINEFCELALLEDQWNTQFNRDSAIETIRVNYPTLIGIMMFVALSQMWK